MDKTANMKAQDAGLTERFAAHCAHDLNNLLTGILGNLELMQSRAKRSNVTNFDGYLEGARNAAGRAADFATRLLAFSGRATQDSEAVPVNALVLDMVELMREKNFDLLTDLAPDAGDVFCDPAQLELALQEVLNNAQTAIREAGTVTIKTSSDETQVKISITDTGTGMTPEIFARACEPFFSTRPNGAGKGLGLAIVKHFASLAGGGMDMTSAPGTGTAVSLMLPKA